jgi:hypothetical protein
MIIHSYAFLVVLKNFGRCSRAARRATYSTTEQTLFTNNTFDLVPEMWSMDVRG